MASNAVAAAVAVAVAVGFNVGVTVELNEGVSARELTGRRGTVPFEVAIGKLDVEGTVSFEVKEAVAVSFEVEVAVEVSFEVAVEVEVEVEVEVSFGSCGTKWFQLSFF